MTVPIAGAPSATRQQVALWLQHRGAHDRMRFDIAGAVWDHAVVHGVDPVVAIGQSALETGWGRYPGAMDPTMHNTCGLRSAGGVGFASFDTWADGALAHIQHLARYAGLGTTAPVVDPRWDLVTAGSARTVDALQGRWTPDVGYADALTALIRDARGSRMSVIRRSEWGAGPQRAPTIAQPVSRLFLHHSVTPQWTGADAGRRLQDIARSRGFLDVSYSWLVCVNGDQVEGRGWGRQGAHTIGFNSTAHAIVLVGNFDVDRPPDRMLAAVADLARKHGAGGHGPGRITHGHRDVAQTSCPGRFGYAAIAEINRLAAGGGPTPRQEGDEMRKGDNDNAVKVLQWHLNKLLGTSLAEDGDYGDNTADKVGKAQDKLGFRVTPNIAHGFFQAKLYLACHSSSAQDVYAEERNTSQWGFISELRADVQSLVSRLDVLEQQPAPPSEPQSLTVTYDAPLPVTVVASELQSAGATSATLPVDDQFDEPGDHEVGQDAQGDVGVDPTRPDADEEGGT